jgi:hypothetical protein
MLSMVRDMKRGYVAQFSPAPLEGMMLLPEAVKKLLHVPATNTDSVWRQAFLANHVVCEPLNQV